MTTWRWKPSDEQRRVGAAVIEARGRGVCWKQLEKLHGRCRRQLQRYAAAVSREKLSQQKADISKMSQLGAGAATRGS